MFVVRTILMLGIVSLFSIANVSAQDTPIDNVQHSVSVESTIIDTVVTGLRQEENTPEYWGLSEQDWVRYVDIMQGPQGRYTPNEDPTFVLGIHARNAQERQRFAELQARHEFRRLQRELSFENAYTQAFHRLYPSMPVVDYELIKQNRVRNALFNNVPDDDPFARQFLPTDRLVLFVEQSCTRCTQFYQAAISLIGSENVNVDLFFLGFSDAQIQQWARDMNVPRELYEQQKIKLNNVNGAGNTLLADLRNIHDDDAVRFFRRRGQRYDPIDL